MHQGRTTLSRETELNSQQSRRTYSVLRPEHDENLWNSPVTITPITNTNFLSTLVNDPQVDDVDIEMEIEESRYNLRSRMQNIESDDIEKNDEESDAESETESQPPLNIDFSIKDLQGASLDDALDTIEGKISQTL